MKHRLFYILLAILPLQIYAENASNVRVQQRGKNIVVTYDLSKTSNVQLLVATSMQPAFTKLTAVEGAVGKRVPAGQDLEIIWHPLEEGDSFIADGVQFRVEALSTYEAYTLSAQKGGKSMETFVLGEFAYSSAPQMSYGLLIGQTYKHGLGWFVDARSNFISASATNGLACEKGGYINGELPFYSGNTKSSVFVAHAGFVIDVLDAASLQNNRFNTFGFYVGVGYGWRELFWETLDGQWVKYNPSSYRGFSSNIGIMGSIYGLTIKAGVNTINFQYAEFEVGLGWMF